MSLRVWLPLNGDLRNNGLSDLVFSNVNTSNTTIQNDGKIGKCYNNNSYTAGGLTSDKTIELGIKQSMFCWFRFNRLSSSSGLGGGLVTNHNHSNNTGMGITIKYVSSTTGYLSVNTGTGSSRTYNTYYGTTLLQANTWYHGGYTYDGNTIKIYVNGICEKEVPFTGMSCPANLLKIFIWSTTNNSYNFNGRLNDVRIYDHALSANEVKELSKGLVCHYPLNSQYIEGTTNLVTTEDCLSATCYNGATNKYGYGANTDMYKTVGNFQGKKCTKLYMGTSGLNARPYPYISNLFVSNGTNQPEYT